MAVTVSFLLLLGAASAAASGVWMGSTIPLAPPDPILGVGVAFRADTCAEKVNLGIGAYRTSEGKPLVLKCVRQAEKRITEDMTLDKEYLPVQVCLSLCEQIKDFGSVHSCVRPGAHFDW